MNLFLLHDDLVHSLEGLLLQSLTSKGAIDLVNILDFLVMINRFVFTVLICIVLSFLSLGLQFDFKRVELFDDTLVILLSISHFALLLNLSLHGEILWAQLSSDDHI